MEKQKTITTARAIQDRNWPKLGKTRQLIKSQKNLHKNLVGKQQPTMISVLNKVLQKQMLTLTIVLLEQMSKDTYIDEESVKLWLG